MEIPAETWKEFAEKDNLVVAGYNSPISCEVTENGLK